MSLTANFGTREWPWGPPSSAAGGRSEGSCGLLPNLAEADSKVQVPDEPRSPGLLPFPLGKRRGFSVQFFFACELLLTDKIVGMANRFPAQCYWCRLPQALWGKHSEVPFGLGKKKSCNQLVMSDMDGSLRTG